MLRWARPLGMPALLLSFASAAVPSAPVAADETRTVVPVTVDPFTPDRRRVEAMTRALDSTAHSLDVPAVLGAARSGSTALFEGICAATQLIPEPQGHEPIDVALGLGCLVASVWLFIDTADRIVTLRDREDERAARSRFALARRDGADYPELFEAERRLHRFALDAKASRVRALVLGGLLIVASGVLATLTVRGEVDTGPGTTISTGMLMAGGFGVTAWFLRSPAEEAHEAYRRARKRSLASAY